MRKHKKHKKLSILILILLAILGLLGAYAYYAVIYRGKTEPAAQSSKTNTDPAVHSLSRQMRILSRNQALFDYAFSGREEDIDYGTYIIPGLKATKTLLTDAPNSPCVCTSMTPQGLAVTEDYLLISAYCHTARHNSVIYVIDKKSHAFVKEVVLEGRPHAGGLAYDTQNHIIWAAGKENGLAQANSFTLKELEAYDFDASHAPIPFSRKYDLYGITRDSFMTYYDHDLYIGFFNSDEFSTVEKYAIGEDGGLLTKTGAVIGVNKAIALPRELALISGKAQGIAFYKDNLLISQSYGILSSSLLTFKNIEGESSFIDKNATDKMPLPQQLEQIYVDGDDLYLLFESGSYAYRGYALTPVDRVLKLDLRQMPAGNPSADS